MDRSRFFCDGGAVCGGAVSSGATAETAATAAHFETGAAGGSEFDIQQRTRPKREVSEDATGTASTFQTCSAQRFAKMRHQFREICILCGFAPSAVVGFIFTGGLAGAPQKAN